MTTKTKINYFDQSLEEYYKIRKNSGDLPRILLHVCCGACSCYPLIFLINLFDITILFTNSNIYPQDEYDKRFQALKGYVEILNKKFDANIKLIKDNYLHEEFVKDLVPYKDEKEGKTRCHICIAKRIDRLFCYAKEHDFKYVTTVMSISRNKDANYLNEIGKQFENKYPGIEYFSSDFKKNGGQDIGVGISKKFDVYRQEYCGCEFSLNNKNK